MNTHAETRVLRLIAEHGNPVRVEPASKALSWTWQINGVRADTDEAPRALG